MIRVNLLPPELRERAPWQKRPVPWKGIALVAAAAFVLYSAGLVLGGRRQARRIAQLQSELERLKPERARFLEVQQSVQNLQRRSELLRAVKAPESRWAPRLNLVSDALLPQVWLTRLGFGRGEALRIEGSVVLDDPKDAGQVSRFLQQLKEQPDFQRLFRDVELQSVEHRQIEAQEIVDFVLVLHPTG